MTGRARAVACCWLTAASGAFSQPAYLPLERVDEDLLGTYGARFPAHAGENPPTLQVSIDCRPGPGCMVTFGASTEVFDAIRLFPERLLYQPRFALKYARDRQARAVVARPDLEPLLRSSAEIDSCVDLDRAVDRLMQPPDYPGGILLLCKLDRNPWQKSVVLLMGTLPANCGPVFCRYEIMPLFRD